MNQDLVERVKRLEKRNRLLFGFLLLMAAVFVVLLCYDFKNGWILKRPEKLAVDSVKVDTLVAGSIEVIGDSGKNSISLGATRDGWAILSFRDLNGIQKAVLLLTPSGKPSLNFFGDKDARLSLGVVDSPSGSGEEFPLHIKDTNNNVIWHPDVVNSLLAHTTGNTRPLTSPKPMR